MTLAVPITIYIVAVVCLVLAVIFGGATAVQRERRAFFQTASWGEIITGLLTFLGGIGAWIGFPAGTIALIIWGVLTIAGG